MCTEALTTTKKFVFPQWQYGFELNFKTLHLSIHTTYPAYFIGTTDIVQWIQQFKLTIQFSSEVRLHVEYSQIMNQTLHSFSSTVRIFHPNPSHRFDSKLSNGRNLKSNQILQRNLLHI